MKNVLIAGGDRIEPIISKLGQQGVKVISHMDGRKPKIKLKAIPSNVDIVLILTDYINHNLSSVIKKKAQEQAIPILFSKRSWTSISTEMKKTGNA
ncbi:DUF2325 domain-containing protein [Metabacillus indicus]|uniref:Dihydroorotate dehydrogenase n=1 Tax=Metabacillus indicus TaxID=246786 RepID=A0A084H2C3_METID|nr:DUF2325 domain-containing protein [Metabacillus indicus]KEZ52525.1 dihydroorotate dehydrogenase [Metabacillus indicus LMG 22858]KEZ53735.1 dihydroorotate dehydrogenase [Metabacillus indicus]